MSKVWSGELPPRRRVRWSKTHRLVPSRYPPVDLFERIADPADWPMLAALEGLTNDRLRDEVGDIALVPADERVSGPGATPIMAAFTHIGFASRFTDGSYGVYYASDCLDTAIAEVAHHQTKFLRSTEEPKLTLTLRVYVGQIDCMLHDVRGGHPDVHDPDCYRQAQALGAAVRAAGGNGVVFDSVRRKGGVNLAVMRPKVLAAKRAGQPHVRQTAHLSLEWDGRRIARHLLMGQPDWTEMPA